jgi:hypothetical protein
MPFPIRFTATPDTDYSFDQPILPGKRRPGQLKSDFLEEEKTSAPVQGFSLNWSELSPTVKQSIKEDMAGLSDDAEPVRLIVRFPGRVRIVGNGKPGQRKHLGQYPDLYREFAKIDNGLALLNFIRKFGRLTDEGAGDSVHDLLDQAKLMQESIAFADKYKRLSIAQVLNLKAKVIVHRTGRVEKMLLPQTLLQALWLQFIYTPLGGTKLIECEYCHEQFWAGPGTDRRADAKFCSVEHQVLFNSRKRSNREMEKRK